MSEATGENILQTVRAAVQDFVAPSLRELTVRVDSLEKRMDEKFRQVDTQFRDLRDHQDSQYKAVRDHQDSQYKAVRDHQDTQFQAVRDHQDTQFQALRDQQDVHFRALMAAISESRAQNELYTYKMVSQLSERVTALEAKVNPH